MEGLDLQEATNYARKTIIEHYESNPNSNKRNMYVEIFMSKYIGMAAELFGKNHLEYHKKYDKDCFIFKILPDLNIKLLCEL